MIIPTTRPGLVSGIFPVVKMRPSGKDLAVFATAVSIIHLQTSVLNTCYEQSEQTNAQNFIYGDLSGIKQTK